MVGGIAGIPHQRAIKAFEKAGFRIARQGKHVVMTDGRRIITIPRHDPINAYTLAGIVRDAGMTEEEFRKLL
jgi:predicted RNA binding protein YcfA (HicA-like mRNA interferase family)